MLWNITVVDLTGGDGEILSPLRGFAPRKYSRPAPFGRDAPYLLTRSPSLPPPQAALGSLPLAGARVQILSFSPIKKHRRSSAFLLAIDCNLDTILLCFIRMMIKYVFRNVFADKSYPFFLITTEVMTFHRFAFVIVGLPVSIGRNQLI